jgi:hypothetical protein
MHGARGELSLSPDLDIDPRTTDSGIKVNGKADQLFESKLGRSLTTREETTPNTDLKFYRQHNCTNKGI